MMKHLQVESLTILDQARSRVRSGHGRQPVLPLDSFSVQVEKQSRLCLLGGKDAGAHAFVMALFGACPIHSGEIFFEEWDLIHLRQTDRAQVRRRLQPVFSDRVGQLPPHLSVDEMFREVLINWYPRESRAEWQERIAASMILCDLPEVIRSLRPQELDAVERQKVALARAMLAEPTFLLAHFFAFGLDGVARGEVLSLLLKVVEDRGLSLLVSTDSVAEAYHLAEQVCVLHRGRVLETGVMDDVVHRPTHDFTRRLVSAAN